MFFLLLLSTQRRRRFFSFIRHLFFIRLLFVLPFGGRLFAVSGFSLLVNRSTPLTWRLRRQSLTIHWFARSRALLSSRLGAVEVGIRGSDPNRRSVCVWIIGNDDRIFSSGFPPTVNDDDEFLGWSLVCVFPVLWSVSTRQVNAIWLTPKRQIESSFGSDIQCKSASAKMGAVAAPPLGDIPGAWGRDREIYQYVPWTIEVTGPRILDLCRHPVGQSSAVENEQNKVKSRRSAEREKARFRVPFDTYCLL